jgi:hypothetical protein
MIPSIWTCGRPNLGQGARRYGPRNASCADKSEIRHIIFWGCFGILSSFPRKAMNTKVGDNFVAHNLDTEFALFGVRAWEIWCRQGRDANQENLDEPEFMETKLASLPMKISCKARWSTPQDSPKCINPRHPRGVTIHIQSFYWRHSPESCCRKMRERVGWARRKDQWRRREEARGGLQAAGLGVFPSFIATIFIDDILRSLHHPYVLQSV